MDVKTDVVTSLQECKVDVKLPPSEKNTASVEEKSEAIFKKPSFIGPKRSVKHSLKKTSQTNVTCENSEGKNDAVKDSSAPGEKKETQKNFPPLQYSEPVWKGTTSEEYHLEELKAGVIESITDLKKKSLIVFGRIECCDVIMAHPTISRYHAVLQYRGVPDGDLEKGFYLYDLDSTHGTFLNGAKLKPKVYARVRVGHMIKFGCSTRFFLLQGPEYDQEEESELTFTELKERRRLELEERKNKEEEELRLKEEAEEEERRLIEERGISWGLGEDADEEEDLTENPYAVTTNEELYVEDPKKALRHWFEREGEELNFETEQVEKGMIACKIVLPLDDGKGQEIIIETSARSKKEAQLNCALEACRTIDRMGLFRQAKQEAKRRITRNWEENDYYDSDEDSFLDRTGDLDIKRQKRMKKVGKLQETVETYESLMSKHCAILKELKEAESRFQKLSSANSSKNDLENDDIDALDAFMKNLKHDKPGKLDIKKSKDEVAKLKKEEEHLRKLINIAKPTSMPELKPFYTSLSSTKEKNEVQDDKKEDKNNIQIINGPKSHEKLTSEKSQTSESEREKPLNKKVMGPILPRNADFINNESNSKKGNNSILNLKKIDKMKAKTSEEVPMDVEDYTNLIWQPPKGQTGDGRTSLNDKLGY